MQISGRILTTAIVASCFAGLSVGCSAPTQTPVKLTPVESSAEAVSPLLAFLTPNGGVELTTEEKNKKFAADFTAHERLVADCMTGQGFQYTPNIAFTSTFFSDADEWFPESHEWVAENGYGVVRPPEGGGSGESMPVDANADYIETLSPRMRDDFDKALYGESLGQLEVAGPESEQPDASSVGCSKWAELQRIGEDPATSDEFKPLLDAVNAFYTDISNTPEITVIDQEWSECMSDVTSPVFARQGDAEASIINELNQLYASSDGSAPSDDQLSKLAERESVLAMSDLDCRQQIGYRDRVQEVEFDLERQFIELHLTDLEAFRAALRKVD